MDGLWSEWAKQGPMVLGLIFVILYLVKREGRTDRKMDGAMKKCEDREAGLVERLQSLEDRQYKDSRELIKTCSTVIETNCRTFEQLTKNDTDKFRAIDKPSK